MNPIKTYFLKTITYTLYLKAYRTIVFLKPHPERKKHLNAFTSYLIAQCRSMLFPVGILGIICWIDIMTRTDLALHPEFPQLIYFRLALPIGGALTVVAVSIPGFINTDRRVISLCLFFYSVSLLNTSIFTGILASDPNYVSGLQILILCVVIFPSPLNIIVFALSLSSVSFFAMLYIFNPKLDTMAAVYSMNNLIITYIIAFVLAYISDRIRFKLFLSRVELARANEKLQELDKFKSAFFTNITHEIRTPLTLILSPVESVLQGDYGNKIDKKFFINLQKNSIRLLKLINNLLDISKIDAGKMIMKIKGTDVVIFIQNYISLVHSAAESKRIELNFVSMNDQVRLFIDLEKFDKIIMNLLSNALKFTHTGGTIKIVVKDDDKNCYIDFIDSGVGIPSDKLESIFERFSQANNGSFVEHEGTGIGLSLVKEFVELHGGTIKADSKHFEDYPNDHGTTIKLKFPKGKNHFANKDNIHLLNDNEIDESISGYRFSGMRELVELKKSADIESDETINPDSQINLLIVDDNPDMRNFLNFLLKDFYNIHLAVNGEDGLKKTNNVKPDLIITDVMMPIMNGYEMTKRIKLDEKLKNIPVIMLTAKSELANKIEGLEYGADDYLIKPFNSKELLTRIRSLLKINLLQKELIDLNQNLEEKVKDQLALIMKGDELKRYLPPQLVDAIIKGEKKVDFGNERRKVTIFFSDIKGFTETTDSMEAEELTALLNEYLTEMTIIAHRWGGTIDKFIGDAIMIFFGAPESTGEKDQAIRCLKMAIDMQNKMKELKHQWFKSGNEYPLSIRIGINTGTATVGNFGAEDRLSYTIIGGQVNLASRLEGYSNPDGILISHSTWALVKEEINCEQRGKIKFKGIHRETLVYDVIME